MKPPVLASRRRRLLRTTLLLVALALIEVAGIVVFTRNLFAGVYPPAADAIAIPIAALTVWVALFAFCLATPAAWPARSKGAARFCAAIIGVGGAVLAGVGMAGVVDAGRDALAFLGGADPQLSGIAMALMLGGLAVVAMAADVWRDPHRAGRETRHLLASPANARALEESIAQDRSGFGQPRELIKP